jgi:hypothetical protein
MTRKGHAALLYFGAAALVLVAGVAMAAARFPGGFDWTYTVVSRLASPRRNPEGAHFAAGALLAAVALLWPVTGHLARVHGRVDGRPPLSVNVLRLGLVGGGLLGIEGLLDLALSHRFRKAHEIVAIFTFLGFYGGVLGLYARRLRESASFLLPALLVVLPLCAVGASQLALYFGQRDLGWVDTAWREMGIPFWLSFAFWQWMAVLFLGLGIGFLVVAGARSAGGGPPSERGRASV